MDSNQTLHFKPVYPHSHINLYNAPMISTTMPNFALASGLNLVSAQTTNGITVSNSNNHQEGNNLSALATSLQTSTSSSPSAAHLVPMTSSGVCLSGIQLQQIPMHQQSFVTSHLDQTQSNKSLNINSKLSSAPLIHVQMTAPSFSSFSGSNSTNDISNSSINNTSEIATTTVNNQHGIRILPYNGLLNGSTMTKSSIMSDNARGKSNAKSSEPSASSSSTNFQTNLNDSTGYVNLAKASSASSAYSKSNPSGVKYSSETDDTNTKGFHCQVCNRDFTQKGNLKTHLMTHAGDRPHECPSCGKNFTQKGNLDTHVKIHTETKDHKCSFCDRGFTQRGNLKTHIRSVHTKEKPYACGHCGKSFSQKGNMLTHFRTHDKDSRYPCNVCGKTFSQKGNLKTHQQRHNKGQTR